jgi:hypothetical protein
MRAADGVNLELVRFFYVCAWLRRPCEYSSKSALYRPWAKPPGRDVGHTTYDC